MTLFEFLDRWQKQEALKGRLVAMIDSSYRGDGVLPVEADLTVRYYEERGPEIIRKIGRAELRDDGTIIRISPNPDVLMRDWDWVKETLATPTGVTT